MQQLGAHADYSRRQRCSSRSRSPRLEDWDRKEGREEARESRRGDNSNEQRVADDPCDLVPLRDHDAVYLRSSCGSAATRKVADVSGAELKLKIQRDRSSSHNLSSSTAPDTSTIVRSDDRGTRNSESYALEVHGSGKQRRAARDFIELVLQQRSGRGGPSGSFTTVRTIDLDRYSDHDLTCLSLPADCVAYVEGRGGSKIEMFEAEWGVLMFTGRVHKWDDKDGRPGRGSKEMLLIFGPLHARRGAEMKVMSSVEYKKPGTFTRGQGDERELCMPERLPTDKSPAGWDVDYWPMQEIDFSYALGTKGTTRKKLAIASGCILEYVGQIACMCGMKKDRRRARAYLRWLLLQRTNDVVRVHDAGSRVDVTTVTLPTKLVGFVAGTRGIKLRAVEQATGTFCFIGGDGQGRGDEQDLLIVSHSDDARQDALCRVKQLLSSAQANMGGGGGEGDHELCKAQRQPPPQRPQPLQPPFPRLHER